VIRLVAVALLAAMTIGCGGTRVVATDRDGRTVADIPAREFALTYRHSYYRQPAVERFRVTGDGFRLVEIDSPSEAVLDYYDVEGTRARRGGWWTLKLARPARFREMPLAATAVGRRTLVADGKRVPLFRRDGRAAHLIIAVEGS
jgi:Domain of unknown function (DUF1850)